MDLFQKCMDPVEKVLKDSRLDKARRWGSRAKVKGGGAGFSSHRWPIHARTARHHAGTGRTACSWRRNRKSSRD